MTPYWTGSTPKRRTAPVSEGPSGALGATEAGQTPVPGIPGSPEGAQGHTGPSERRARMGRRRVRRHAQAAERANLAPAPVRDAEGPQNATEGREQIVPPWVTQAMDDHIDAAHERARKVQGLMHDGRVVTYEIADDDD